MPSFSRFVAVAAVAAGALALPTEFIADNVNATLTDLVRRGSAPNYVQNYIAGGANCQFSYNQAGGSFSVNFNTQSDFVVGLGWQPGNSDPISFTGDGYSASGVGLLSIYGWSTNPLVEYYVIENPIGYPKQGTQKGTFTSDGSVYEVWQHQQTNQPSIQGTSTFQQYISIRQSPRNSGTVTIQNHFDKWASLGMKLGTLNYQVLAVESWGGSGKGSFTVAKGASSSTGGSGSTGSATTSAVSSPSATGSTGGSGTGSTTGAAQWGQCGGTGWTGPTTCQSPYTCHWSNNYYSQCY